MIRAYDKTYLDKARTVLGRMLDFAAYDLGYDVSEFFQLFLQSGLATRFGAGDCSILAGVSGVELAYEVLDCLKIPYERIKPTYTSNKSQEYWVGWALAYYQWETALSFSEIVQAVPISDMLAMYSPYHEMDIRQFVDHMNALYRQAKPETNLKTLRMRLGISQRELSELSGVPLRTIQQYEQRQKNINKAQAIHLLNLSHALCCDVKDLMETITDTEEK